MSDIDRVKRDQQWAGRIQVGDPAAFEKLFRAYAELLCNFVNQYTGSPEIAEEIVQDLFLKIWKERATWSPTVSVKSYLYAAARNLALDYLKHKRVVEAWQRESSQDGFTATSPSELFNRKQLQQAVRDAIASLPPRCRQVFQLSRQHGLTYREIATVLDLSIKTVETHMRRAFCSLRRQLASHRPESSTFQ
jgi:RNA polymerase sigma-70 factor (ECF subfamily)